MLYVISHPSFLCQCILNAIIHAWQPIHFHFLSFTVIYYIWLNDHPGIIFANHLRNCDFCTVQDNHITILVRCFGHRRDLCALSYYRHLTNHVSHVYICSNLTPSIDRFKHGRRRTYFDNQRSGFRQSNLISSRSVGHFIHGRKGKADIVLIQSGLYSAV